MKEPESGKLLLPESKLRIGRDPIALEEHTSEILYTLKRSRMFSSTRIIPFYA